MKRSFEGTPEQAKVPKYASVGDDIRRNIRSEGKLSAYFIDHDKLNIHKDCFTVIEKFCIGYIDAPVRTIGDKICVSKLIAWWKEAKKQQLYDVHMEIDQARKKYGYFWTEKQIDYYIAFYDTYADVEHLLKKCTLKTSILDAENSSAIIDLLLGKELMFNSQITKICGFHFGYQKCSHGTRCLLAHVATKEDIAKTICGHEVNGIHVCHKRFDTKNPCPYHHTSYPAQMEEILALKTNCKVSQRLIKEKKKSAENNLALLKKFELNIKFKECLSEFIRENEKSHTDCDGKLSDILKKELLPALDEQQNKMKALL